MNTTRPIKEISILEFKNLINNKQLIISGHALNHLEEGQRKYLRKKS